MQSCPEEILTKMILNRIPACPISEARKGAVQIVAKFGGAFWKPVNQKAEERIALLGKHIGDFEAGLTERLQRSYRI